MTTPADPLGATWSIGELAAASGVTERMLRHWGDVGVLTAGRTASGHRRYRTEDVTRLYRAVALRRTGLPLADIARLLDDQDPDPVATLRSHLAFVDLTMRRQALLRDRMASALEEADHGSDGGARALTKVIETMTMFEQYVHGYRRTENVRLRDQATTLVDLVHAGVGFPAGSRVLEVGCGVGAQTVTLLRRSPDIRLTAVDISAESLAAARNRVAVEGVGDVEFHEVDVRALPHDEGPLAARSFDHVFVCFVLEHLEEAVDVLARLRQMLAPGGTITVVEGDHGSTYFHPESAAAREAIGCQVTLQRHAGGDANIGRRLYPLLVAAGFEDVRVSPLQVYVDASRPELVEGFIRRTFTAMIEGVREAAVSAGLSTPERFDEGIRDLHRTAEGDGVFCYTFFSAHARGGTV